MRLRLALIAITAPVVAAAAPVHTIVIDPKTGAPVEADIDDAEAIEVHGTAPITNGTAVITADEVRNLPGGATDALAAVRSLPGVASAPPTTAGRLVIRGGAPQDSLLTIDGVPVPFVYHAFDNTTVLPVAMVGAIAYSPGGFGVDEGRATSGTVALTTSELPPQRPTGQASVSVLDASATGSTPLAKGLYLSGGVRRSTVDLLIPIAVPASVMVGFTTPPRYYDGQLKLDWIAGRHDRVSVFALTSYDRLGVVNHMTDTDLPSDFDQNSKFGRLIASWSHDHDGVTNRLVGALGDGDFHAKFDTIQHVDDHDALALLRDDLTIDLGVASRHVRVRAGFEAELEHHDLDARSIVVPSDGLPPGHFDDLPILSIATGYDTSYAAAYAAIEIAPTDATKLVLGGRLDHFDRIAATVPEPRAELAHRIGDITLRAAAGVYARDHDQLEAIPTNLLPERATQISGGADLELGDGLVATGTVYHTWRRDLAIQDPARVDELAFESTGVGRSTGVDLMLRLRRDRLFGWVAYSFGRTERRDEPDATWHHTAYDQTHVLTAVASYQTPAWRFGARFQLATGMPYTDIVGGTYVPELGHYVPVLGSAYAVRYPDSSQLDLRIERVWHRNGALIAAFVDIANALRTGRVIRYTYNADFTARTALTDYVPLPSIGVRGEI